MQNLQLTVDHIKTEFSQKSILLKEFDYNLNEFIAKVNPKYLYRGEKIYPTTKSNYHRLAITNSERDELNNYILDISISMMESFFGIVPNTDPTYKPRIFQIGAFLQHYGFPIMWLDFTEDIEIAAFFASYKNNTGKGKIWIIETQHLIENGEKIMKLENTLAKRPTLQKAYALRMFDDKPDFQNAEHFKKNKIDFDVSIDDIKYFDKQSLLCTGSDQISDFIINYIEEKYIHEGFLKNLLLKIKNELKTLQN